MAERRYHLVNLPLFARRSRRSESADSPREDERGRTPKEPGPDSTGFAPRNYFAAFALGVRVLPFFRVTEP
jgi:hypothetical protein